VTEVCGIALHPAGHTLSPVIHAEAYRELGLDAVYRVFDVPPGAFPAFVERVRAEGYRQLSVSLPHKEAALRLADRGSDAARAIGAANTLTRADGALVADNTDWIGVTRALEPHGPWPGRRALVLGAGGAARGVVYALLRLELDVAVHNRTRTRAEQLVADLGGRVARGAEPWDLLVNATSVGMEPNAAETPLPAKRLRPGALVFDSVYRPLETRLLREARAAGCRTQDGLDMLVHQAVEQLRLWSGRLATPARLRAAALRALEPT
jgi:shikimate dehydrogenase